MRAYSKPRPLRPPALALLLAGAALLLAACAGGRPSATAFASYEAMLVKEGRLRTETAPADAPFTAEDLVRNFERIALRHEADSTRPGAPDNALPNPVQRWEGPIRYFIGGRAARAADRAEVRGLMVRIARLTGLDIAEASSKEGANFLILITAEEERDRVAADLARSSAAFARTFDLWRRSPEIICAADNLFHPAHPDVLVAGLVVIGEETGGLLRRACIHEEVVQAFGLANDDPDVRPSIFNDDGEFALLTKHDEYLLRILYDPRLRPGMTAAEALPVVREIVAGFELPGSPPAARLADSAAPRPEAGGIAPAVPDG